MSTKTIKDVLKCYIVREGQSWGIDVETFLPAVCYIKNGKITDFMFDSFIFLPSPNYLYDYAPGDSDGRKPMNKTEWQEYIEKEEFMPGRNIDALEKAVGIVKKEVGREDYKANVFMSLFYPHSDMHHFGEVDGEDLDLQGVEGKKKALKWMVNHSIREFEKRGYQNLQIGGFYWFTENISRNPEEKNEEFLRYITDYIRSLGYITIWSAWYNAPGHDRWREIGFDFLGYQPNYFPENKKWPNQGNKERLELITKAVERLGVGVEIEMADFDEKSVEVVKEYYDEGAKSGWINSFHIYYMASGPVLIRRLAETENELLRSAYDCTYQFIKRTYNPR